MSRSPSSRMHELTAQVRANPRLQAGLAVIGLLFGSWLFLVLGDLRKAQVQRLELARERYIQVKLLSGQDEWIERAAAATRLADALEAEIPSAKSAGLAQAAFQSWLKQIVDSQGAAIRMDTQAPVRPDTPSGDIVQVNAMLAGSMDPRRVWQMIHRIEGGTSLVNIPVVVVRSDGMNQTFSLTVQGFYRIPARTDTGAGSP